MYYFKFEDFLGIQKPDRARIRVEHIIREDVRRTFSIIMTHRFIQIS